MNVSIKVSCGQDYWWYNSNVSYKLLVSRYHAVKTTDDIIQMCHKNCLKTMKHLLISFCITKLKGGHRSFNEEQIYCDFLSKKKTEIIQEPNYEGSGVSRNGKQGKILFFEIFW